MHWYFKGITMVLCLSTDLNVKVVPQSVFGVIQSTQGCRQSVGVKITVRQEMYCTGLQMHKSIGWYSSPSA